MKKLTALLSGVACCCLLASTLLLAGPLRASAAGDNASNPYFQLTKADDFGNKSISVLGDSISHGANAPRIYEDSYLAQIKQALWAETGYENYGFASMENTMWNSKGTYHEVYNTSWNGDWTEQRINDNLGRLNLSTRKQDAVLNCTVEKDYRYLTVYYEVNAGGTFDVIIDGKTALSVDTSSGLTDKIGRSAYIELNNARSFQIKVTSSGQKVALNGFGFYNNTDGAVINNYASNGSKLIEVSDNVLDFVCSSDVLIMAHGYNDSHFQDNNANREKFTEKIDYIINQVKKTGCRVIVNDMCWSRTASNFFRTELKRLAAETNALYFSAEDVYGKEMISSLNDGVHPGIDGHHMIGNALLAAMKGEPMPTIPTTSSPSAPTPSYVVKDGYAIAFQAPLKDTSVWQVGDGQLFAPYPEAVKPALILTPQEDGLVIVRTNDSLQPWTDARTYVDTTVDLTADKLYYKINAECLWNMTLSFADEKDSLAEDSMVKLGSYIVKQQKGTSIGYHEDAPAGVYEGFLDLTEVIQDAVKQEVLSPLYAESLSAQYIGRLNFWHVAGTPNQSKVIISDLFIGHEDSNASDATNTDPSDPTETPDDTTTAPTDGGTAPSTPKDNPQTGENTLLLLVDAFLLLVSVGMLLITHKMRKAEK